MGYRWGSNLGCHFQILGVVFISGKNVNIEIVKAGLAEVYRGKPTGGLDLEPYWNAEACAKKAGIGMWSLGINPFYRENGAGCIENSTNI